MSVNKLRTSALQAEHDLSSGHFLVGTLEEEHRAVLIQALQIAERKLRRKLERLDQLQAEIFLPALTFDVGTADEPAMIQMIADQIVARVEAAFKEQIVPLSFVDKITLRQYGDGTNKQAVAQAYHEIAQDLSTEILGDPSSYDYANIHVTNLHRVVKLWWQQKTHGSGDRTLKSIPISLVFGFLGALGGVPIEGARVDSEGRLIGVSATGHGINLGPALLMFLGASALTGGAAPLIVGGLTAFGGALSQFAGGKNSPAHEIAHAIQFLVLGDALNSGLITAQDFYDIQNDIGKLGYLWKGQTEDAAEAAEFHRNPTQIFEALIALGNRHFSRQPDGDTLSERFEEHVLAHWKRIYSRYKDRDAITLTPPPS